jgi:lysyl-tRNA synthetase class 2
MGKYPARTRRNCSIEKAKKGFEQKTVWLAGRIIGILDDGFVLQDESGRADILSSQKMRVRVGDIVEVEVSLGEAPKAEDPLIQAFFANAPTFKDKVLIVHEFKVLAPCQGDFFISKEDPNYKRMIVDASIKERLRERVRIFQLIREFFEKEGFLEVDTPLLVRLPGMEPYLDVFKTRFFTDPQKKDQGEDMYLITSPEYAMKKLLVAGYEKIFQIARSFRNKETASNLHNPEFSLLEWYRAYAGYEEVMEDCEKLVHFLTTRLFENDFLQYQGSNINVSPPWPRLKVRDAFLEYAGIQHEDFEDPVRLREAALKKGYKVNEKTPFEDVFFLIFMNEIEPKLGFDKPVILFDYPIQMAALSKACEDDPRYAERFEIYIAGMELANAFTELNDPDEQRKRLEAERLERQKLQKDDYPVDQSFISALEFGMPPSAGPALGVDRLIMLLTDTPDINNVLFFPHKDL